MWFCIDRDFCLDQFKLGGLQTRFLTTLRTFCWNIMSLCYVIHLEWVVLYFLYFAHLPPYHHVSARNGFVRQRPSQILRFD